MFKDELDNFMSIRSSSALEDLKECLAHKSAMPIPMFGRLSYRTEDVAMGKDLILY